MPNGEHRQLGTISQEPHNINTNGCKMLLLASKHLWHAFKNAGELLVQCQRLKCIRGQRCVLNIRSAFNSLLQICSFKIVFAFTTTQWMLFLCFSFAFRTPENLLRRLQICLRNTYKYSDDGSHLKPWCTI